jgi:hypothetical protein
MSDSTTLLNKTIHGSVAPPEETPLVVQTYSEVCFLALRFASYWPTLFFDCMAGGDGAITAILT